MKPSIFSLLLVVVLLMSSACVKKDAATPGVSAANIAPELTVKKFVEISAGVKSDGDRQKLLELCQGELRRAFERMTPEAFKVAYLSNAIKVKEVKILDSKIENNVARISYEVSLENSQGTDTTLETNTREVELVMAGNTWLIETIRAKGSDSIAFTRGMIF
jgi:hypothetical protein